MRDPSSFSVRQSYKVEKVRYNVVLRHGIALSLLVGEGESIHESSQRDIARSSIRNSGIPPLHDKLHQYIINYIKHSLPVDGGWLRPAARERSSHALDGTKLVRNRTCTNYILPNPFYKSFAELFQKRPYPPYPPRISLRFRPMPCRICRWSAGRIFRFSRTRKQSPWIFVRRPVCQGYRKDPQSRRRSRNSCRRSRR